MLGLGKKTGNKEKTFFIEKFGLRIILYIFVPYVLI
jgi:hypothetical protein